MYFERSVSPTRDPFRGKEVVACAGQTDDRMSDRLHDVPDFPVTAFGQGDLEKRALMVLVAFDQADGTRSMIARGAEPILGPDAIDTIVHLLETHRPPPPGQPRLL